MKSNEQGFTLIELLIVVLIIGILSAIAVPQYQKAVLKSRFSSLMPTTQAIRDGNEMYYMTNGGYADALAKLDVTTANTEDMTITLSDDSDYSYTMATRPNINNNLIMYQKHSANFPGEIHCEALKGNKHATWLCEKALHGTKIGGSLTTGYSEYILEGSGKGVTATVSEELAGVACPEGSAENACKVTENEDGSKTKMVCTTPGTATTCTYTTTNTDGSTTVCNGQFAKYENGKCIPTTTFRTYEVTTDEDGNSVKKLCSSLSSGKCTRMQGHRYDANGKETSGSSRDCSSWNTDGSCSVYSRGSDFTYEYDTNGKKTSQNSRICSSFNEDGSCSAYSSGSDVTYEYTNGKTTSQNSRNCSSFNADGVTCSAYSSGTDSTWTYEGNTMTSQSYRTCSRFNTDGSCSAYKSGYVDDYTTSPSTRTNCNSEAECAELLGIPLPEENSTTN